MSGHTPGPWREHAAGEYEINNDEIGPFSWCGIAGPDGDTIALPVWAGRHDNPRFSANARLISAAPELLAIAQSILDRGYVSRSIAEERDDHEALVAAIAKATGA